MQENTDGICKIGRILHEIKQSVKTKDIYKVFANFCVVLASKHLHEPLAQQPLLFCLDVLHTIGSQNVCRNFGCLRLPVAGLLDTHLLQSTFKSERKLHLDLLQAVPLLRQHSYSFRNFSESMPYCAALDVKDTIVWSFFWAAASVAVCSSPVAATMWSGAVWIHFAAASAPSAARIRTKACQ